MNEIPKQRGDIKPPVKKSLPSYWSGVGWIFSGVVMEIIGRVFAASVKDSTRGLPMGDALNVLNQVAKIQGFSDLIMVVLVIIGIIVLVRTFRIRSKAKKSNAV